MRSGIYQITNSVNGKRYIGRSTNLQERWKVHLSRLRHNTHHNYHLQAAFNKHGESAFAFSVLEYVEEVSQLTPREQHFLDTMTPEYNIASVAGSYRGRERNPNYHEEFLQRWTWGVTGFWHAFDTDFDTGLTRPNA